jgi:hypothetical protein
LPIISWRVWVVDPLEGLERALLEVTSSAERVGGEMAAGGAMMMIWVVTLGCYSTRRGRKKHDPLASIIQIEFRAV